MSTWKTRCNVLVPCGSRGSTGEGAAAGAAQSLAGEVVAPGRYFADDLRRQGLIKALRKLDRGAAQPMTNEVDVVLADRRAHDARTRGKHVADLLALAQKASRQVLRFHDRKGALAAAARNEALGATGRGRELGSRLPQFRGRDLCAHAVGETLGGKPRLELGDTRAQDFEFGLERGFFALDQRFAGGHNLAWLDQQGAHETVGSRAHDRILRQPDHAFGRRVGRRRDQEQHDRGGQDRAECRGHRAGSVAVEARAREHLPQRLADGQRDTRQQAPDRDRDADGEILARR